MSITLIGEAVTNGGGLGFTLATAGITGDVAVVQVSFYAFHLHDVSSVTDANGNVFTRRSQAASGANNSLTTEIWTALVTTATLGLVSVALPITSAYAASLTTWRGLVSATPDQEASRVLLPVVPSFTITATAPGATGQANELAIGNVAAHAGNPSTEMITPDPAYTQLSSAGVTTLVAMWPQYQVLAGVEIPELTSTVSTGGGFNVQDLTANLVTLRGVEPPPQPVVCGIGASGPLQFLELDGLELANAYRNFQYLRLSSGEARPKWEISSTAPCSVLAREIGYTPTSPVTDPAPWYDPFLPESADFLGLIVTDIEGFDFNVTRAVTQRQSGVQGALLGPQLKGPRELKFTATLLSDGACCGIEYGKRWLIHRLAQFCDGCSTQTLRVRLVCPPDSGVDDSQGEWYVFDAALVDGPHWQNPQPSTCCDYQDLTFTMVSEDPYLYRLPVICSSGPLGVSDSGGCIAFCDWLNDRSTPVCCSVDVPSGYGEVCGVVTIETASVPVGGVEIRTYADPCGPSGSPLQTITIPFLPADSSLTYDSARQRITFTDAAGVSSDGTPYISLEPGRSVEWVQVSDCAPARCICVDAAANYSDGSASVTLATQFRAL